MVVKSFLRKITSLLGLREGRIGSSIFRRCAPPATPERETRFEVDLLELEQLEEDEDEWIAVINGGRYRRLTTKSNRICFKVDDLIFKLNWSKFEYSQSKAEFEKWNRIKLTKDREYFVEAVAFGTTKCGDYHWVAMKWQDFDDEIEEIDTKISDLISRLAEDWDIGDLRTSWERFPKGWQSARWGHPNWAFVNGKPMIFDYGFTKGDVGEGAESSEESKPSGQSGSSSS